MNVPLPSTPSSHGSRRSSVSAKGKMMISHFRNRNRNNSNASAASTNSLASGNENGKPTKRTGRKFFRRSTSGRSQRSQSNSARSFQSIGSENDDDDDDSEKDKSTSLLDNLLSAGRLNQEEYQQILDSMHGPVVKKTRRSKISMPTLSPKLRDKARRTARRLHRGSSKSSDVNDSPTQPRLSSPNSLRRRLQRKSSKSSKSTNEETSSAPASAIPPSVSTLSTLRRRSRSSPIPPDVLDKSPSTVVEKQSEASSQQPTYEYEPRSNVPLLRPIKLQLDEDQVARSDEPKSKSDRKADPELDAIGELEFKQTLWEDRIDCLNHKLNCIEEAIDAAVAVLMNQVSSVLHQRKLNCETACQQVNDEYDAIFQHQQKYWMKHMKGMIDKEAEPVVKDAINYIKDILLQVLSSMPDNATRSTEGKNIKNVCKGFIDNTERMPNRRRFVTASSSEDEETDEPSASESSSVSSPEMDLFQPDSVSIASESEVELASSPVELSPSVQPISSYRVAVLLRSLVGMLLKVVVLSLFTCLIWLVSVTVMNIVSAES